MDAVTRTSMQYGLDLGIDAGKEDCCGHSRDGGHAAGLAIDINVVGGTHFIQMSPDAAATLGNMLGSAIVSRLPFGTAHILATPGMAFDINHPITTAARLQKLLTMHRGHVHVTIDAP
jgi:hypothetical protein